MRVLIVGGGALGTVMAGRLSRAGNDVTLFVKPAQAAALAGGQVEITGILECTVPVRITANADNLGHFDCLMLCVKGRDTEAALEPLRDVDVDAVLSLQNGVKKNETLAEIFGRERVLGAIASVSGEMKAPGRVLHTAAAVLDLGELDGHASPRCERIAAMVQEAGIPSSCVPDIGRREWQKLTLYMGIGLVSALTRVATVTMIFDPDLGPVCARVARETADVAAAEGYDLNLTEAGARQMLEGFAGPIRDRGVVHWLSLVQDLMAGRPTELEATAGDVLARARRHALAAPTIDACTNMLRAVERLAPPGGRSAG